MEEMEISTANRSSGPRGEGAQPRFVITALVHRSTNRINVWQPPTDYFELANEYIVRVEIAGMENAEFKISYEEKALMIQGKRKEISETGAFRQMEIRFGDFVSYVEMAGPVDVDGIQAEYEDGFLTVTMPKLKPSRIDIQP
ncbi:MAG: Hsp20/alpha crystallin family protein [Anaerolineae bacterium]|nr:Hsp20/alpha crystallin family protein [Anaerolineae bacterium]